MTQPNPPSRIDGLLQETITDEVFLCDPYTEMIYVLNPTARPIREPCGGQHSLAEIGQVDRSAFSVQTEMNLQADIREALAAFGEKVLLIEV